ncbi:MAG: YIP1 family protein [Clostridia bacterium]|nr:YIP1 family protein [Clostridia bacterium]
MKKLSKIFILTLVLVMLFGTVNALAFESYETYTYSIDGEPLKSPAAYDASQSLTSVPMGITQEKFGGKALKGATDIVTDDAANVYIADKDNNRIVVLNKYYSCIHIIDGFTDKSGNWQTFNKPQGVFVTSSLGGSTEQSLIYICDTLNMRIVVFDRDFNYVRTLDEPKSALLRENSFKPMAIAVDLYGRLFITSTECNEGVIVMSKEGDFTGFIGAQKADYSIIDIIWRRFQTKEQREQSGRNVSIAYNNITVDSDGFVYATTDGIKPDLQIGAIKSKNSDYSPIKKLNSAGAEIMKRNGFFDPGGEVMVSTMSDSKGASKIIDVAIGRENSWSILDSKRSRIFTYDQNGNLLFAFGDIGDQLGNGEDLVAITYHEVDGITYLLTLDNANETAGGFKITVYSPTEYCDTIMSALHNQNEHLYSEAILYWQDVLTRNNNFDLAYIGIGKALYSQEKYEEAMEMLKGAYETETYSKAFAAIRKNVIGSWVLIVILVGVIALIVGMLKFFGWAKKKNKLTSLKVGRKTYVEELIYAFHLWLHPFDGFWDLKHEQRGSVRAGSTIMGITILAFFYQAVGQGYTFNPRENYSTIIVQILSITVPVMLWCVGNWCLTTLFDGEGSFKDIYVATTYSLAPLPLLIIISTILTNVMTVGEGSMVNLLVTLGYIWVAFLLFFGTLVTHDYSLSKNILTVVGTIAAMVVIMFVAILFSNLVVKMVTFVSAIISEIGNRL